MKGHEVLGYRGHGIYACECGTEFKPSKGLLKVGEGDTAFTAMKDQWNAHRKGATKSIEVAYDTSLDPISPDFDIRSWFK